MRHETDNSHRVRIFENSKGLYEWALFLSPQTRRASARSPKQYDSAWKARNEALEFARKWSRILKNNYSVIDRTNDNPIVKFTNGEEISPCPSIKVEDLVGDKRAKAVASEIEALDDADFFTIKALIEKGIHFEEVSRLYRVEVATIKRAVTMGVQ